MCLILLLRLWLAFVPRVRTGLYAFDLLQMISPLVWCVTLYAFLSSRKWLPMRMLFLQDTWKVLSSHVQRYHMLKHKQGWMIGAFVCLFWIKFGVLEPLYFTHCCNHKVACSKHVNIQKRKKKEKEKRTNVLPIKFSYIKKYMLHFFSFLAF